MTGHAEVAQVTYDPAIINYAALLNIFWDCHDPTALNRQGSDRGEQSLIADQPHHLKTTRPKAPKADLARDIPGPAVILC